MGVLIGVLLFGALFAVYLIIDRLVDEGFWAAKRRLGRGALVRSLSDPNGDWQRAVNRAEQARRGGASGDRSCIDPTCPMYARPTEDRSCDVCHEQTFITTVDLQGPDAQRARAALPAETPSKPSSPELPEGDVTCQRLNCMMRGVPTNDERCGSCQFATIPLASFRGELMSAPGVVYDPHAVTAPEPAAISDTSPGPIEDPDDGSVCMRIGCNRRGVRTTMERCQSCGHRTAPAVAPHG